LLWWNLPAFADNAHELAAEYQKCVLGFKHVPDDRVKDIATQSHDLYAAAQELSRQAVLSCATERGALKQALIDSGNTEAIAEEKLLKVDAALRVDIKVSVLNASLGASQTK
jgi:hypothetical protein